MRAVPITPAEMLAKAAEDYDHACSGCNMASTPEEQDVFWAEMQAARARMALALKEARAEMMQRRRSA